MTNSCIKTFIFLGCFAWVFVTKAQTVDATQRARVAKSTLGVQTGYLGFWGYYEHRLTDRVSLRSELGTNALIFDIELPSGKIVTDVLFSPTITVESRWYYNLGSRMRRLKDITDNSGDFIALQAGYIHGLPFFIPFERFTYMARVNAMPVLLMWGMRRNLGRRFNYELGAKGGFVALPDNGFSVDYAYNVHLRIGYRFLGDRS